MLNEWSDREGGTGWGTYVAVGFAGLCGALVVIAVVVWVIGRIAG